jgi:hypothetical protein
MSRDNFTILDALLQVGRHWRQLNGSAPIHTTYIKTEVVKLGETYGKKWEQSSIMLHDLCYNHSNINLRRAADRMFLKCNPELNDGLYEFVDLNYHYIGPVHSNPRKK